MTASGQIPAAIRWRAPLLWCVPVTIGILLLAAGAARAAETAEAAQRRDALRLGQTEARREAAAWLGRHGAADSVPALVQALRDEDQGVRLLSENAMWEIWMRSGDETIDHQMRVGAELMQEQRFEEALEVFDEIVKHAPEYPEGYNKRATALYYLGEYERSLADIKETLARNQFHFGALSGAGLCWMAMREAAQALYFFERALAINPNLGGVRDTIEQLRRVAEGQMM